MKIKIPWEKKVKLLLIRQETIWLLEKCSTSDWAETVKDGWGWGEVHLWEKELAPAALGCKHTIVAICWTEAMQWHQGHVGIHAADKFDFRYFYFFALDLQNPL